EPGRRDGGEDPQNQDHHNQLDKSKAATFPCHFHFPQKYTNLPSVLKVFSIIYALPPKHATLVPTPHGSGRNVSHLKGSATCRGGRGDRRRLGGRGCCRVGELAGRRGRRGLNLEG